MDIYNSLQDFIAAQTDDKWVHIGFSAKNTGDLHTGHGDVIRAAHDTYPDHKVYASIWTDGYRQSQDPYGSTLAPGYRDLDRDYMDAWMEENGADAIYYMTDMQQIGIFHSALGQEAIRFVAEKDAQHDYISRCSQHQQSELKWCLEAFYLQYLMGLQRRVYAASNKNGWYTCAGTHFLKNYCNCDSYLIEPTKGIDDIELCTSFEKYCLPYDHDDFQDAMNTAFAKNPRKFANLENYRQAILQDTRLRDVKVIADDEIVGPNKYCVTVYYSINNGDGHMAIRRVI